LAKLYGKQPQLIPVEDFSQADRERVLELLLSQERVVSLLYAKTFPLAPAGKGSAAPMDASASGNNFELSQLLDNDRPVSPANDSATGRPSTATSKVPTLPAVNGPNSRMISR